MKKLVLTSFILIVTVTSLSAQSDYGIRAGFVNLGRNSNVFFENDGRGNHNNFNQGVYFGVYLEHSLTERFSIRPEVNFKYISNDFNQLHVPILANYRIGNKFNVFLGPDVNFLLTDNKNFRKANLGVKFGASYQLLEKLAIETTGFSSFTESLKDDFIGTTNMTTKFNSFQIGLVYKLGK